MSLSSLSSPAAVAMSPLKQERLRRRLCKLLGLPSTTAVDALVRRLRQVVARQGMAGPGGGLPATMDTRPMQELLALAEGPQPQPLASSVRAIGTGQVLPLPAPLEAIRDTADQAG